MWPDRVSNVGPLTYESGALRGLAICMDVPMRGHICFYYEKADIIAELSIPYLNIWAIKMSV